MYYVHGGLKLGASGWSKSIDMFDGEVVGIGSRNKGEA
jgi:hypothetical protein